MSPVQVHLGSNAVQTKFPQIINNDGNTDTISSSIVAGPMFQQPTPQDPNPNKVCGQEEVEIE